jgi:hypothetical protein
LKSTKCLEKERLVESRAICTTKIYIMKYLYLVLNWVFGVIFCLFGILFLIGEPFAGICLIAISFLLLPPVRNALFQRTNKTFPFGARAASIFMLIIACFTFLILSEEESTGPKVQNINEESSNISEITQKKGDESEIQKTKALQEFKTQELIEKLKTVTASDYVMNKYLYQELVKLNPENETYSQKLDHYKSKREKELLKLSDPLVVKFGERPKRSPWDGSYYAVEDYLKRIANDPDSIKIDSCTDVYKTNDGWLVGCNYRGRNVFNGMVRQSNWFTIVHGKVVKMHDAAAYSP